MTIMLPGGQGSKGFHPPRSLVPLSEPRFERREPIDPTTIKIVSSFVLFSVGAVAGLSPRFLVKDGGSKRFLSRSNCFAGGIFFGAGLIHLLPDAADKLSTLSGGFPLAFAVCSFGFLSILSLELSLPHHDSRFKPLLLLVILAFHSLVCGIALGLEVHLRAIVILALALSLHKGSAAFALAVSSIKAGLPQRQWTRNVLFFSCMTPLGIFLGIGLSTQTSGHFANILEGLFDSVAAGLFLYIALFDILQEEVRDREDLFAKVTMVVTGLLVMVGLAFWS